MVWRKKMTGHVAVLMGGWSSEREVSLASGKACSTALRIAGYRVSEIDVDRDIANILAKTRPDICFNALHGPMGEDGNIQGLLNIMGIPYTHSGLQASALAIDKVRTKELFRNAGLKCPNGSVETKNDLRFAETYSKPFVIKPIDQGSSVGVNIIKFGQNDIDQILGNWNFGDQFLVEEFIPGRELTVSVLDGEPLCVTEITSDRGFYDYDAKYISETTQLIEADLDEKNKNKIHDMALKAFKELGCKKWGRVDILQDKNEQFYILEINTVPGMTSHSCLPKAAEILGVSYKELVQRIIQDANL